MGSLERPARPAGKAPSVRKETPVPLVREDGRARKARPGMMVLTASLVVGELLDQPGRLDPGGSEGSLGQPLKGLRGSLERGFRAGEGRPGPLGRPVLPDPEVPKAPQETSEMTETILWYLADVGRQGLVDRPGQEALGDTLGSPARMGMMETKVLQAVGEPPVRKGPQGVVAGLQRPSRSILEVRSSQGSSPSPTPVSPEPPRSFVGRLQGRTPGKGLGLMRPRFSRFS